MLTPMNIAIIGGVVVLLLLMVKMRKDRAAAAKPASAQKERRRSRRADAVKQPKVKEPKGRRGRRGPASIEAVTSQAAATLTPEAQYGEEAPVADAASFADEWGEDPAAEAPAFADEMFAQEPAVAPVHAAGEDTGPIPAWQPDDVVTAPGWPMPGEMDGGWATGGGASHIADVPVVAPAGEPAESWSPDAPAEAPEHLEVAEFAPEPLAEVPDTSIGDTGWDEDAGFDPAAGWGGDSDDDAPLAAGVKPSPDAADGEWSTGWTEETTGTDAPAAAADTVTPEVDGDALETWGGGDWEVTSSHEDEAPADVPGAVAAEVTPLAADEGWATSVAEDDDWSAAAGEAFEPAVPAQDPDWEIASSEAAAALAPEAPTFASGAYAGDAYDVFDATPADAPAGSSADTSHDDQVGDLTAAPSFAGSHSLEQLFGFTTTDTPGVGDDAPAVAAPSEEPVVDEAGTEESLLQWAALAPTTPAKPAGQDAAARWAAIAPIAPKARLPLDPTARWAAISPIAPAGGAPKRDRHDTGELTGRFALGGFAVQDGYQVVTGVTFRFAADDAPAAWAFGPCPDAQPGTLVIDVEGVLNCAASDIEVVDGPGFAPTCNGFTLRLTAPAGGPFAASGSYRIV